jgi:hypothetical protein
MKKNTKVLLDGNKEIDLEVNAEKTKDRFMSCQWNAGQNHILIITNKSSESVT